MTTSERIDRAYLCRYYPCSYAKYIINNTRTQMWEWLNADLTATVSWNFARLYLEVIGNENKNAVLVEDRCDNEALTK